MRLALPLLAGLALAACSSEKESDSESADDFAARIDGTGPGTATGGNVPAAGGVAAEGVFTADGSAPGSSLSGEAPPAMPQLAGGGDIPTKFRGVWDFIDGSCARESDLRMEVRADRIGFYESTGNVRALEAQGDDRVTVDLAMSGEGETWTERLTLSLVDGGRFLETGDVGPYGDGQALRRKRCP